MVLTGGPAATDKVCSMTLDDSAFDVRQPHEQTFEDVIAGLATNAHRGLTSEQVNERQTRFGSNVLRVTGRVSGWRRLVAQFTDPQVYLLLSAVAVAMIVWTTEGASGVPYEALIILAIVVLNAFLGYFQENRAERALASLQKMAPAQASVIRDGEQRRIMTHDLVPGDIILLVEGDSVPADGRLVLAQSLMTSESSLTGESLPVRKDTAPVARETGIGDRSNMVFAGTTALSGNGRAIITAIGMKTEFGKIANLLDTVTAQITPLQSQLKRLSKQMGAGVLGVAVCVVITLLAIHGIRSPDAVMNILLFGIALAVAATPEGLAAIITLVLAIGVQRMAHRGAIVRKLSAAETLGSATVIVSDKTGTMTRNEMTVRIIRTASGESDVTGTGYSPKGCLQTPDQRELPDEQREEVHQLLVGASLVNNAQLTESAKGWTIHGDPTEAALLVAARKMHIQPSDVQAANPRLAEIVFSSERKRMSTVHLDSQTPGNNVIFAKGAPEILLGFCTREFKAGLIRPLTSERIQEILRDNERLTGRALRTLGVAMRSIGSEETIYPTATDEHEVERDLAFLGLVGMMDPPPPRGAPIGGEGATRWNPHHYDHGRSSKHSHGDCP